MTQARKISEVQFRVSLDFVHILLPVRNIFLDLSSLLVVGVQLAVAYFRTWK